MDVYDIVKKYLKENGFDGLCTDDCGCHLDDLMPCCQEGALSCEPGYAISVEEAQEREICIMESCDFVITTKNPKDNKEEFCEYCSPTSYVALAMISCQNTKVGMGCDNKMELYGGMYSHLHKKVKINYCPMCGRDLKGE